MFAAGSGKSFRNQKTQKCLVEQTWAGTIGMSPCGGADAEWLTQRYDQGGFDVNFPMRFRSATQNYCLSSDHIGLVYATQGAERLSVVRGFARHLAARDGKSEVPDQRLLGSRFRRGQPHVYSEQQLRQLIESAAAFPSADPLRAVGYATLFGLLASTGMRVSEPLALRFDDVDLDGGVLRVLETKFRKSRLVPLHPTLIDAMRRYAVERNRDPHRRSSNWFFLGRGDERLPLRFPSSACCSRFEMSSVSACSSVADLTAVPAGSACSCSMRRAMISAAFLSWQPVLSRWRFPPRRLTSTNQVLPRL